MRNLGESLKYAHPLLCLLLSIDFTCMFKDSRFKIQKIQKTFIRHESIQYCI